MSARVISDILSTRSWHFRFSPVSKHRTRFDAKAPQCAQLLWAVLQPLSYLSQPRGRVQEASERPRACSPFDSADVETNVADPLFGTTAMAARLRPVSFSDRGRIIWHHGSGRRLGLIGSTAGADALSRSAAPCALFGSKAAVAGFGMRLTVCPTLNLWVRTPRF